MENEQRPAAHDFEMAQDGIRTFQGPAEFDAVTAPTIEETLEEAMFDPEVKKIVIDLGQTTFLDSTGIRTLIHLHKWSMETGKEYVLTRMLETPRKVLELTGVINILRIDTSED